MTTDYFKQNFHFSPLNNISFYSQLYSFIKFQIQAGVFMPGEQMLSENELCDVLNVSRTTIRLSLGQLVDEGLLIRYRGKGSFIAEKKIGRNINYLYNFTESIRDANAEPSSVVLSCQQIEANELISKKLQLPDANKKVFMLERLRCADKTPLILESTFIPYFLCPDIEKFDFSVISLYDTLRNRYSLSFDHAVETIEAIIIKEEIADQLRCPKKLMPGYKIGRVSYLYSGQVFEYTNSITRADKCEFQLDLYSNPKNPHSCVDFSRKLNP